MKLALSISVGLSLLVARSAHADAVTDWNQFAVEATKGFDGAGGSGVTALDSNLATRIEAVAARAVFDAVNSIDAFAPGRHYYYSAHNSGSAAAAAAQAAHDVLQAELPNPATQPTADARWALVRTWLDGELASYLAGLGVSSTDGGIAAGAAAAQAAVAARTGDGSSPVTTYGATLTPTSNPGVGLWRQTNSGAPYVNPATDAPTGFDSTGTVIQGKPGIDSNWPGVAPFSLTPTLKSLLVGLVPASPKVGSKEYNLEVAFTQAIGQDSSTVRTADQTAQALYYKQDAEIFVNEAARIAAGARGISLDGDAALFALLDNALVDARIAAFTSKYDLLFWRPITAINANPDGSVTNGYAAWHPLAATPAHPSNTSGHSATAAAGFQVLRTFFGTDSILPGGGNATLGSLPWLAGTNSGTGNVTTRSVSSFTQTQLETGASRIYLGVHFGFDNLQGQLLGLAVADAILYLSGDPATSGLRSAAAAGPSGSLGSLLGQVKATLSSNSGVSGFFAEPSN